MTCFLSLAVFVGLSFQESLAGWLKSDGAGDGTAGAGGMSLPLGLLCVISLLGWFRLPHSLVTWLVGLLTR